MGERKRTAQCSRCGFKIDVCCEHGNSKSCWKCDYASERERLDVEERRTRRYESAILGELQNAKDEAGADAWERSGLDRAIGAVSEEFDRIRREKDY